MHFDGKFSFNLSKKKSTLHKEHSNSTYMMQAEALMNSMKWFFSYKVNTKSEENGWTRG